jgi:hypothetical protein
MGLSPEYFWSLTWYEWGLEVTGFYYQEEEKIHQQELTMDLTRRFMALFANAQRTRKSDRVFKPEDFIKLSYDTKLTPEADPELFARVAKRLGGKIKKKESGDE